MGNSYNTPHKLGDTGSGKSGKFKSPPSSHPVSVPKGSAFTPGPGGSVGARAVDIVQDSFAESRFFSAPAVRPPSERSVPVSPKKRPTVIRWTGGGRDVAVALEQDGFQVRIPLSRSENEFHTILELDPGQTHYRFVVDGVWKTARDQPVALCDDGGMANVVVLPTVAPTQLQDEPMGTNGSGRASPFGEYSRTVPDPDAYTKAKEPPGLPAHLEGALLNHAPTSDDSSELPTPAHVVLNHLYSAVRTDGVLLFSMSHRYRSKFTTTVFYTKAAQMTVKETPA